MELAVIMPSDLSGTGGVAMLVVASSRFFTASSTGLEKLRLSMWMIFSTGGT